MRWLVRALSATVLMIGALASQPADARRSALSTPPGSPAIEVDVQLVLAVDVSLSMDTEEQRLQREGYIAAFRSELVHKAIGGGMSGRIAVVYMEWSGDGEQTVVVPWTLVDSPATANAFANALERAPISRMRRTSISSAMLAAQRQLETSIYFGMRRVIDFSGDGSNNEGPSLAHTRAEILAKGTIVNGLPLLLDRVSTQNQNGEPITLEMYYDACVIGGVGSFQIPVRSMAEFRDALKTKLILEIAAIEPDPDHLNVIPASEVERPNVACDGRFSF